MTLPTRYNPIEVEKGKYQKWKNEGYFKAGNTNLPRFSMVIPPPNVTGKLHLGHTFNGTIQDILARYKKAKGFDVLWLPGMDHAGIATQAKVEAKLREQNLSRFDLGREDFLKRAWDWKHEYAESIHGQWEMLGLSLDYSKERFTLDEGLNEAVNQVFVKLYNKGLIYQGERIINWDPVQMTALSNIEVIHKEEESDFFYFKYPIVEDKKRFLTIATTRPETMFGDVCVVVNPNDERYTDIIGKHVINPANGDELIIIADEYVDIEFGTGAMKCTPAHDFNDFILGEKHGFKPIICMNKDATMNEAAKGYIGLDRYACRKQLVMDIERAGNLIKIEKIINQIGHSERSDAIVEPYLSKQWFVKMKPLAERSIKNQEGDNAIRFFPERFNKVFLGWMEKIEDWCISRQLWWGHRIPAYYHKQTGEVVVSLTPPKDIENYTQDEDVLDTWFSSALWPFSTLGWPENTSDLKRYFPIDVMVTAYDIIFFWVSRMIFQSLEFCDSVPFKDVLIHGLIRDPNGKKMSKSLGNGIDPVDIINTYGTDALRYFITTTGTPGQDSRYIDEKVASSANYLNKIWNASRFILSNLPSEFVPTGIDRTSLNQLDKFILAKLNITIKKVTENMENYEFGVASTHLYDFVYDDFCSWYLEMSKVTLQGDDLIKKANTEQVLYHVLKSIILLIYPFTPFICEEIYLNMPNHKASIMLEPYPILDETLIDETSIKEVSTVFNMIKDVRNYKVEHNLAPNAKLDILVLDSANVYHKYLDYFTRFMFAKTLTFVNDETKLSGCSITLYDGVQLAIKSSIDKVELIAKINQELELIKSEMARCENMLNNPNFINKAPEAKIAEEKEKLVKYKDQQQVLLRKLKDL